MYRDDKEEAESSGQANASSSTSPSMSAAAGSRTGSAGTRAGSWSSDRSGTHEELRRDTLIDWKHFKAMIRKREAEALDIFSLQAPPSTDYISHNWFDHLLSFFGPSKAAG